MKHKLKVIKRKPRCLKLYFNKQSFMSGLLNKDIWVNFPIAPPA